MKKIGILALQGAFVEHEEKLRQLGAECFQIRQKHDLQKDFDGLILPGGESTVISHLLQELDMFELMKDKINQNLPVLATCAGLILLASHISNETNPNCKIIQLATLPVTVRRNGYGRQLGSFVTSEDVKYAGKIPLRFIRAPYIETIDEKFKQSVEILATVDNKIVGVQYKKQIGLAFHPEITDNTSIHTHFLNLCS